MILQEYRTYNSSFKKQFIYRLGAFTGFFSEYNNMILAMHYCMVNRIQFVLESEGANFSSGVGWNEFFEPFCTEIKNKWLKRFNHRIKPTYKNRYEWFCFNAFKRLHPNFIYMYSLFEKMRSLGTDDIYDIKEMGLHGNLLDNCSEIHKMIWNYNSSTATEIDTIIQKVSLPQDYIGLHIRQGDKGTEAVVLKPETYMEHAKKYSDLKNVFVLTDDYRVLLLLKDMYPDYIFFTLCQAEENGYDFVKFCKKSNAEKRKSYMHLWASMDILERSKLFVGTYSANPGMNMGFRMSSDRIKCVDFEKWQLW